MPANTLKEFVAYLRANEKKVTEADAGVGSISNLACSVFHSVADVHPTVASYRGTPQATMDLVAGNVDFGCNQIVNIVQHIKTGKLKAYAVTSDKRSPMLPDVPTTTEAGMPQFNLTVWFGLSAPKGTPRPIVDKLNKALDVALNDPDVVKRFADLGYDVVPPARRSPDYFDKFYKDEVALWAKVLGGLGDGRQVAPVAERNLEAGATACRSSPARRPAAGSIASRAHWRRRSAKARLLDVPVEVVNVPGDGARRAWTQVVDKHEGDGHVVAISSPNLTSDYLVGLANFEHSKYTPIATLVTEYIAFAVRTDSDLKSGGDLLARLRADAAASRSRSRPRSAIPTTSRLRS